MYIKVDNEARLMQVSTGEIPDPVEAYNVRALMSHFNVFSLTSTADQFICTMTGPELTMVPYGKAVIYINKMILHFEANPLYAQAKRLQEQQRKKCGQITQGLKFVSGI